MGEEVKGGGGEVKMGLRVAFRKGCDVGSIMSGEQTYSAWCVQGCWELRPIAKDTCNEEPGNLLSWTASGEGTRMV